MFVFFQQIKDALKNSPAKENKFLLIFIGLGFILNVLLWIFLYWKLKPLSFEGDGVIPLHYNIYLGIDYIGPWYQCFSMPALGLFVLAVNSFLAFLIYLKQKILSYFLVSFSLIIQIFLLIAGVLVVLLNV